MAWNDDYYSVLEKDFGRTEAALIGQSHREAIDWVESTAKEESIHCNFSRLPGYLVPHDDLLSTRHKVEKVCTGATTNHHRSWKRRWTQDSPRTAPGYSCAAR